MHEAKLCLSLIDLAEDALAREQAERILSLTVEVGALSGVVAESLSAAFPICAAGSRAEGARLCTRTGPGRELVLRDMEVI